MRLIWVAAGLTFTSIGFLGLILPLLPGTPFFLLAAWAFTRSSPRLHDWLLSLPGIGGAIRDHRAGLGVSRRVKLVAIAMAATAVTLSAIAANSLALRAAVIALGVIGVWFVGFRLPTRERVLAQRAITGRCTGRGVGSSSTYPSGT